LCTARFFACQAASWPETIHSAAADCAGTTGKVAFDQNGDRVAVKESYDVYKFGPKGGLVVA
jgi:hypothetical protein